MYYWAVGERWRFALIALKKLSSFVTVIQLTPDNSNQSRFPLDFLYLLHTFTVILPSVTRILDNSNLPLTRSNFFPFRPFLYSFTLDNSKHAISSWQVRKKKPCTEVQDIEFISKQPRQFFVFTFLSLQFKFSVHSCILCCLVAFPPHPFAYFLISGYLLQTLDN